MEQYNKFQTYIAAVCDEVKYKRSHNRIKKELENHMEDQLDSYITEGFPLEEAIDKTIKEMGDPIALGINFNQVHKPKSQKKMIGVILLLSVIGLFLHVEVGGGYENNIIKTMLYFTVGISIFVSMYYTNLTIIAKYSTCITFLAPVFIFLLVYMNRVYVNGLPFLRFGPLSIAGTTLIHLFPVVYSLLLFSMRKRYKYSYGLLCMGTVVIMLFTVLLSGFQEYVFMTISTTLILVYGVIKGYVKYSKKIYGIFIIFAHITSWCFLRLSIMDIYDIKDELEQYLFVRNPHTKDGLNPFIEELIGGMQFLGRGRYTMESFYVYKKDLDGSYMLLSIMNRYGILIGIGILMIVSVLLYYGFSHIKKIRGMLSKLLSVSILLIIMLEVISHVLYNLGIIYARRSIIPFVSRGLGDYIIYMFLFGLLLAIYRDQGIDEQTDLVYKKNRIFRI